MHRSNLSRRAVFHSRNVRQRGHLRDHLGHAAESPGWSEKASGSLGRSRPKGLWKEKSEFLCLGCFPRDLIPDKRKNMDGWKEGYSVESASYSSVAYCNSPLSQQRSPLFSKYRMPRKTSPGKFAFLPVFFFLLF